MKKMRPSLSLLILGFVASCFLVSGCAHRLPNVKASEVHQTISFPGFTSTADATGINVTDSTIKAADASWRVSVMGVSVITTAKDFQQKREKDDKP